MSAMSNYLESGIMNHLFRSSTFSKPSEIAIALCRDVPTDAQTGATIPELPDDNGYQRKSLGEPSDVTWGTPTLDGPGGSGTTQNTDAITFESATSDWGYVSGIAIVDNSGWGSGNVLLYGALQQPRIVLNGDQFQFNAGQLDIFFA